MSNRLPSLEPTLQDSASYFKLATTKPFPTTSFPRIVAPAPAALSATKFLYLIRPEYSTHDSISSALLSTIATQQDMATHTEYWTCSICFDDFPPSSKPCKIPLDGNEYHAACSDCLYGQFLSAIENEINYPVKWQTQILHPRQFPNAFDHVLIRAYEVKEKEYKTPALQRVYCDCGTFVAPMVVATVLPSWLTLASSKLCPGCEARWCLRCAQRCGGFGVPHECVPERRLGERRLALGGLKKGRDFQVCPGEGCGRMIELTEACNAITCQCGTNFCYVCGEPAEPGSEHWMRDVDGCPRYGVEGSGREMFDDDFGQAEEEDIVAVADDVGQMVPWGRGEGESTTFDFIRWAWQAAMVEGTAYDWQLDVMLGDGDEAQTIDETRRAMEMYNPVICNGASEEQWQELVKQHSNAVRDWLSGLHSFVRSGAGRAADHLGGTLLDFEARHIFNIAIAEDRDAAALWVQQANDTTTEWISNHDIEVPGSAVFDVGPGGVPGESWRIRDMAMFEDVPPLGLYKLAGGALLAMPRPQQVVARRLEGGLFGFAQFHDNDQTEHEDQIVEVENTGLNPQVQDEDQTVREEQIVEGENTRLDPQVREVVVLFVASKQVVREHLHTVQPAALQSHPIMFAMLRPFPPVLLFIIKNVFVGVINQEAYDQEYGLVYRERLQISGSWPAEDGVDGSPHSDLIVSGWYSQDVFLMRVMFMLAWGMMMNLTFTEWRTFVRSQ